MVTIVNNREDEGGKQRGQVKCGVEPHQRPALPEVSLRLHQIIQQQQNDRTQGIAEHPGKGSRQISCFPLIKQNIQKVLRHQENHKE